MAPNTVEEATPREEEEAKSPRIPTIKARLRSWPFGRRKLPRNLVEEIPSNPIKSAKKSTNGTRSAKFGVFGTFSSNKIVQMSKNFQEIYRRNLHFFPAEKFPSNLVTPRKTVDATTNVNNLAR